MDLFYGIPTVEDYLMISKHFVDNILNEPKRIF